MLVDSLYNEKHNLKKKSLFPSALQVFFEYFLFFSFFFYLGSFSWTQPLTKMDHHLPPSQKA